MLTVKTKLSTYLKLNRLYSEPILTDRRMPCRLLLERFQVQQFFHSLFTRNFNRFTQRTQEYFFPRFRKYFLLILPRLLDYLTLKEFFKSDR